MLPKKLASTTSAFLGNAVRSPQTAKRVSEIEDQLIQRRHEGRVEDGTLRGVRVIVYRGWIADGIARVHVRVVEAAELPGNSRIPYWDIVSTNLRRHAKLSFPGVEVTARLAGVTAQEKTDRHGFAAFKIDVGEIPAGWHEVEVSVPAENPDDPDFVGKGRVLRPSDDARIAIISDIDDTVLRTGLNEGFSAFRRTMFGEATTRSAVPGMSSLYRGVSRGVLDKNQVAPARPGVFYVSTGSWSFYEMLVQFLQLRGYPRGPLFLTDWGPSDRYLRRSGRAHKDQAIRRIAKGCPDTPLVLIGDSGQQDPEIYTEFATEYPGRVAMILIISAGSGSADNTKFWQERSDELREQDVPLHVVDNALEAAHLFQDLNMCDALTVEEVETEMGAIF